MNKFEPLELRQMLDAGPVISEFMAINNGTLADEDGSFSDWIEVHNPTSAAINLDGWYLTDNAADLDKWRFPAAVLGPGDYLVVFASDENRLGTGPKGELHTNFKLNGGGEYLALVDPDGPTIVHAYTPQYPEQLADVSYGLAPASPAVLVPEEAQVAFHVPTAGDTALGTAWTEPDFNATAWSGFANLPTVLITEAATGALDYVEIQNVSSETVDTSGWVVVANDPATDYRIDRVYPTYWKLPAWIVPGEVLYRHNDPDADVDPGLFWGGQPPLNWRALGPGWVLLMDDAGNVVDFVVWGHIDASLEIFPAQINDHDVSFDDFLIQPRLLAADKPGIEQFFVLATPGGTNRPGGVAINEIHLNPDVKTEPVEFVELHNWSSRSVDLSGWSFTDGVFFTFPEGTTLAAGAYVVVSQDPAALQNKYGVSSLGPYVGQLANGGEKLVLRDAGNNVRDEVDYGLGFPWPTVGDYPGYSSELIHPALDNDLGGSWRTSDGAGGAAGPTPGAANSVFATVAPPQIRQVKHTPVQPASGQSVTISVKAIDPAGVPSPNMAPLQFRVIDDAQESNPSDQYDSDLWGLYWTVEHPDGRFLDERNLPDGNVYKMEGGGDKKNQGPTDSPTNADINSLLSGYGQAQSIDWWRANINLRDYYSFRAVNREVNNMDMRERWNVFYYHNPDTDQWSPVPWDLDMLYGPTTWWSGVINMQNYNPRSSSNVWPVHRGAFYTSPADAKPRDAVVNRWLTTLDHEGMAQWIKDFMLPAPGGGSVPPAYGFNFLASESSDVNIPNTPTITYLGASSFPINDLTFRTSPFGDPQGAGTFAALQWRIGEVTDPAAPAYDPAAPIKYEVVPVWQSGEITILTEREITLPPLAMEVGHAYRARVRMKDNTGRWSHWSEPIQFVATDPNATALSNSLRITEIMYHPAEPTPDEFAAGFTDKDLFEFIELQNIGTVPLDLTNVALTDGVHFAFGAGNVTTLHPGEYAVVVKDTDAFTHRYGTEPDVAGEYDVETEQLSNGGERITLVDAHAGVLSDFAYNDAGGWPGRADGKGASLELIDLANLPAEKTPAAADFLFHAGNDDTPDDWIPATAPSSVTFLPGAGTGGSDRVTIVWPDDQIRNTWLQVTVPGTNQPGPADDDVFYIGNAVAEAGNSTTNARVTTTDLLLARNNPRDLISGSANITFSYDFDRDGQINANDVLLARNNQTSFLNALKVIDLSGGAEEAQGAPLAELAWLSEFDEAATHQRPASPGDLVASSRKEGS